MRPRFEQVYAGIANARAGKATILLALNRYNDWIGWCESRACPLGPTTPAEVVAGSRLALEAWNKMVCETATKVGFDCVTSITLSMAPMDWQRPVTYLATITRIHPS